MSTKENKTATTTPPYQPKMKNVGISFKEISKQNKRTDKLSTYILDTDYEANTNTVIKYYETFSEPKIEALLQEAYSNLQYAEVNNIDFFSGEEQDSKFIKYIMFLISVRFTSLDKTVPTNLPEQIPMFLEIVSNRLFERIFDEVLPADEVARVLEKLQQFTSLVNQIANLEESTRNEILSSVQNQEILNYTQTPQVSKLTTISKGEVIHPLVDPTQKADK